MSTDVITDRVRRSSLLFPRFVQRRSSEALARTRLSCGDEMQWNLTPGIIRTVQPQGLSRKEICAQAVQAALVDMSQSIRPIGRINYGQLQSLDDLFHSSYDEIDRYPIPNPVLPEHISDPENPNNFNPNTVMNSDLCGCLCNSVFRSKINGSFARTPWYRASESLPSISLIGIQQTLMNVMCFQYNSKAGEQSRLIFRPPFRGDFSLSPRNTTLQQVSVTSSKIGEFLVYFTCALIRIALGIELFYPTERVCHNIVVTTHLRPMTISLERLQQLNPTMVEQKEVFDGRILKDPEFPGVKLLIFPTGAIIIVGGKNEHTFRKAMAKHIPIICQARTRPGDIVVKRRGGRQMSRAKTTRRIGKRRGVGGGSGLSTQGRKQARKRKISEAIEGDEGDLDIQLSRPLKRGKMILGASL